MTDRVGRKPDRENEMSRSMRSRCDAAGLALSKTGSKHNDSDVRVFEENSTGAKGRWKHTEDKLSDNGEFDPGSGRTLAACFIHASRTRSSLR